jgi:hypothetical protein
MTELKILTMHPDVQSYFYYENSGIDKKKTNFTYMDIYYHEQNHTNMEHIECVSYCPQNFLLNHQY